MATKTVEILRSGNVIVLDPTTDRIAALVAPQLSFVEKKFLRGRERVTAIQRGQSPVFEQEWECFSLDHKDRIATSFGFLDRIRGTLEDAGYAVAVRDLRPHKRPEVYAPDWGRILDDPDIKLRYKQKAFLRMVAEQECGRVDCPTGWGKSTAIGFAAIMLPRARIDVISRNVAVVRDRIYPELCQMLPSVGLVGGGVSKKNRRVMCYTFGSVHHAVGDADYVFIDEVHQAAADDIAGKLGVYRHARMFGLSASHDMRLDNKDLRCEAMCGPIRLRVSYARAVREKIVVPITVIMSNVITDIDPCAGYADADRKRHGIWKHDYRNRIIARDARLYDDDVQTLITVETLEHALELKRLLPEFTIMYNGAGVPERDWRYYEKQGLLYDGFRVMTDERRAKISRLFEQGRRKKVICTTVWNVGVNMRYLQVLIRADGGGSPINDVQIPGRTSRTNEAGKLVGIVHDYLDQFNSGAMRKARGRIESYTRLGWTIVYPRKKNRSTLRQLMEWGEAR